MKSEKSKDLYSIVFSIYQLAIFNFNLQVNSAIKLKISPAYLMQFVSLYMTTLYFIILYF